MHRPERYNAKARAGGSHKKGKSKKKHTDQADGSAQEADANAEVVERKSEADKEQDRRTKMRQQVRKEPGALYGVLLKEFCTALAGV
jgi:ATP-dependent RNA helicase DHX37/DHR1